MSQQYEIHGRVVEVTPIEYFGFKEFPKRFVIIDDQDDNYPQQVPVSFAGKKAELPDTQGISRGDDVTATFSLRGNEWKGKWFAEISGFKIARIGQQEKRPKPTPTEDPDQYQLDEEDAMEPPF